MSLYPHIESIGSGRDPKLPMKEILSRDANLVDLLIKAYGFSADGSYPPLGTRLYERDADRLEAVLKNISDDLDFSQQKYEEEQQVEIARQSKIIKDRNEAIARLEFYERERGLIYNEHNDSLIRKFIETSPNLPKAARGVFSAATVDIAVSFLGVRGSNALEWAQPKEVVELPPPPPEEKLGTVSDGLPQLPISTRPSREFSVQQLKDLDRRQRAAKGHPANQGWHGGGSIV